ncbi:MAG: hypothetical protein AB1Z23_05980 [Eubacteriales bacterium]
MWTNRAHFIGVYLKINKFVLPIFLPVFIVNSLICELGDLVCFFTFFSKKIRGYVEVTETTVQSLSEFKQYDFVDIDVKSDNGDGRVKIKICTR